MLQSLYLHNFKCFGDQELALKHLTLLSGLNGMGKSSVIQALLLLRQSYQQRLLEAGDLAINGDLISLGTARDILYEGAQDDKLSLQIRFNDDTKGRWHFLYDSKADVLEGEWSITKAIFEKSLFTDDFQYLQAERLGPRITFGMSDYIVRQHRQLGPQGEYTAHFLALFGAEELANPHLKHPEAPTNGLANNVEAWMGEISPGTRLELNSNPDLDLVGLRFAFNTGGLISNAYRPTNVGFGLTYTLPILVAALSARPGALLLIENPEAHLHPKGQATMGELLARTAAAGVQVIIESHSDHVLNGIRLAVHGGRIPPTDIQLHYFQRQGRDGEIYHTVTSPSIDRDGRIDHWPDGFFDEWDKSLDALLEPPSY